MAMHEGRGKVILNATLVLDEREQTGSVLISEDGRIARVLVGERKASDFLEYEVCDARGCYALPGVIDAHVHFRDPGLTHKGDIASESKAAVAGGVTSYMDMPNTKPMTVSNAALEEKLASASGRSWANFAFYLGATRTNVAEITGVDPTRVPAVKLFMGSSTGNMQVDEMSMLETVFRESPILVATHCETDSIIQENTAWALSKYGEEIPFDQHPVIRNTASCVKSMSLAIELANRFEARLHVLHLSAEKELNLLKALSEEQRRRITAETCPHYLLFDSEDYLQKSWRVKCNPAIKYSQDKEALRQALRSGLISTIGTDHAPHLIEEKEHAYAQCPSGMPSIQFSLVLMLTLAEQIELPLHRLLELMVYRPASLFGIVDRGQIAPGYFADIVLVERLAHPHAISEEQVVSRCGWTPYANMPVAWRVKSTYVNGNLAYDQGRWAETATGQPLRFTGNRRQTVKRACKVYTH